MKFNDDAFIYRILGIDNGSSMLGCVVADLDLRTGEYHVIDRETFEAERLITCHKGNIESHGLRWAKQRTLCDHLRNLVRYHNPHAVAVETPFFMPRRVQSFEVLTEMKAFIREVIEDHSANDIYGVSPGEAKRAVQPPKSGKFTMKKVVIKDAVLAMSNITYAKDIDKNTLTEHEYDGLAVIVHHGESVRRATGFLRG